MMIMQVYFYNPGWYRQDLLDTLTLLGYDAVFDDDVKFPAVRANKDTPDMSYAEFDVLARDLARELYYAASEQEVHITCVEENSREPWELTFHFYADIEREVC